MTRDIAFLDRLKRVDAFSKAYHLSVSRAWLKSANFGDDVDDDVSALRWKSFF
jgi:hypothetical protein